MTDRGRWIWLDDKRREPVGWERATTAVECVAMLARGGVDVVDLDHDLRPEHYAGVWSVGGTGYDVALWIRRQAESGRWDLVPKDLRCHSLSDWGRKRILAAFAEIKKMRKEAGK